MMKLLPYCHVQHQMFPWLTKLLPYYHAQHQMFPWMMKLLPYCHAQCQIPSVLWYHLYLVLCN